MPRRRAARESVCGKDVCPNPRDQCERHEERVCKALLGHRKPTKREKQIVTAVVLGECVKGQRCACGLPLTDEELELVPLIRRAIRRAGKIEGADVVSKRYKSWAVDVIPGLAGLLESPSDSKTPGRRKPSSSRPGRGS